MEAHLLPLLLQLRLLLLLLRLLQQLRLLLLKPRQPLPQRRQRQQRQQLQQKRRGRGLRHDVQLDTRCTPLPTTMVVRGGGGRQLKMMFKAQRRLHKINCLLVVPKKRLLPLLLGDKKFEAQQRGENSRQNVCGRQTLAQTTTISNPTQR